MSFPIGEDILYVISEPTLDFSKISNQISEIIK